MWNRLYSMKSSDKDLLIDYMWHVHAPAHGSSKNWNTNWNYYTQMIRWIAALACLRGCSVTQAAGIIHDAPERVYIENGQPHFYTFERWKRRHAESIRDADMWRAWEVSGETGDPLRKNRLEYKAMGCDIQLQL